MNAKTILIADDDEDIVTSLSKRCKHMGLKVTSAQTAYDALMSIRTTLPDVVCLDINMPAGDGLSICQMLMSDQDSLNLPVIILTGNKDVVTLRRIRELNAPYVPKGGDVWGELEPLLRSILKMPASLPEPEIAELPKRHAVRTSPAVVFNVAETSFFPQLESD